MAKITDRQARRPFTAKIVAFIFVLVLLWLARSVWDYFDSNSPANLAMQVQLKMFAAAIYEFHTQTGRWPRTLDDLAYTSLATRSRVWRQTANTIVFLWPQNLHSDPKDNANVLLEYWRGGWFNKFGRVWVCWGDLRTERMREGELRTMPQGTTSRKSGGRKLLTRPLASVFRQVPSREANQPHSSAFR